MQVKEVQEKLLTYKEKICLSTQSNQSGKLIGWRWGKTGKLYKKKEDAEKQERAILASGWKEKRKQ